MSRVTVTTDSPLRRGSWVRVGDEQQVLRVVRTTGTGPFTSVLRPVGCWTRQAARLRFRLGAPRRWWLDTRCLPNQGWCWRRATYDYCCDRHNLEAVEWGEFDE